MEVCLLLRTQFSSFLWVMPCHTKQKLCSCLRGVCVYGWHIPSNCFTLQESNPKTTTLVESTKVHKWVQQHFQHFRLKSWGIPWVLNSIRQPTLSARSKKQCIMCLLATWSVLYHEKLYRQYCATPTCRIFCNTGVLLQVWADNRYIHLPVVTNKCNAVISNMTSFRALTSKLNGTHH